jgi:hypothetical protein
MVHGIAVEVACYGEGTDWVCRLSYAREHRGPVNDGYIPPPIVGVAWVREQDHRWFASGMVNRKVFRDQETIYALIDKVRDVTCPRHSIWYCVELVEAKFVSVLSGEAGFMFAEGGGGSQFDLYRR